MEIKLNDSEIRQALAGAISTKTSHQFNPHPDDCWFEAKAGEIEGDQIGDIHDVQFCFKTD